MSEDGANVTADTLFHIGSCSKAFLAATMGVLMDDLRPGKNETRLPSGLAEFDWNTCLDDLLPESDHGLACEYEDSTLDIIMRLRHLKMTHGMYILGSHIITVESLLPDHTVLPARVLFDITEVRAIVFGNSPLRGVSMVGYGMGWMRWSLFGDELVHHSGAILGYRAIVKLLPRENAGVVALTNSDDLLMLHQLMAMNIVNKILGHPLLPEPSYALRSERNTGLSDALPAVALQGYPEVASFHEDAAVIWIGSTLEPFAGTRTSNSFALTYPSNETRPALLAEWPRLLATHVRLAQESHARPPNMFWMTTHYMFPEGYGANRSPFHYELFPPGYGLKPGLQVRKQADVWFEKIV
ncbi:hypothetical protein BC628DRAFT_1423439 [Trametes gibbosa]|nr:hypothetical protein BC628DRAFT_1423439 [Trametes gibbosa]